MTATDMPRSVGEILGNGQPTADKPALGEFEGQPVESATIAIRNAGDGADDLAAEAGA